MILTKDAILNEIKNKTVKVTPFKKENIGPASIDLTLDNKFRVMKDGLITLSENVNYKDYSKLAKGHKVYLKPGHFVLGITKEKIKLPDYICGWLTGRTRFARLGLAVHVTASFVNPGVNNKQVLEIKNVGESEIILKPGLKICQLVLQRTEGKAKYKGKFQGQKL